MSTRKLPQPPQPQLQLTCLHSWRKFVGCAINIPQRPDLFVQDTAIQEGIQQLRDKVSQISSSRIRSLDAIGDGSQAESTRIDALTAETRTLMHDLKERIRSLENSPIPQDAQLRNNRVSLKGETILSVLTIYFKIKVLRKTFLEAIQNYQREEQDSRSRSRQRVERQLKIGKPRNRFVNLLQFTCTLVKPDATPEEVAVAVDGGGQQIFAEAVSKYFASMPSVVLVLTATAY